MRGLLVYILLFAIALFCGAHFVQHIADHVTLEINNNPEAGR